MVGEPVQQRPGQAFRAEYLGPFVERQITGHQSGAALVTLAEHLEQKLRAGFTEWHEAEFVDDQQLEPDEFLLEPQKPPLIAGLHQFVDEGRCGGKADSEPFLASGQAKPQGDVGLAGA